MDHEREWPSDSPADEEAKIDQSAEDSFPASDPPSFTPVSGEKKRAEPGEMAVEAGRVAPPESKDAREERLAS